MQIITSQTTSVLPQIDGRNAVDEVHIDDTGRSHYRSWLAEPGTNLEQELDAYARKLEHPPPSVDPLDGLTLDAAKAVCKAIIDRDAETARLKYITPGAGQALEYQHVADEATRYQATNGLGSYPMLQASVDAGESATLAEAAVAVLQQEAVWASQIGPQIRKLRKAAKIAIDAATTIDQVRAATRVTWP